MTADLETYGFPPGYFVIRSVATNLLLDVTLDDVEDGTEIILFTEKESSLVETFRNPEANNQVFFVDTSGALCSRSAGHAIDIEDDRLVLRHRRPVSYPFPNSYSHPLPKFSYSASTGEISVIYSSDPTYPPPNPSGTQSNIWQKRKYLLSSIPLRKPRTLIDNVSAVLSSAIASPFSFLSNAKPPLTEATPDEVFSGVIDLNEDEILEEERGEEAEVDDSPDATRKVRVLSVIDGEHLGEKAQARTKWLVTPLRKSTARVNRV